MAGPAEPGASVDQRQRGLALLPEIERGEQQARLAAVNAAAPPAKPVPAASPVKVASLPASIPGTSYTPPPVINTPPAAKPAPTPAPQPKPEPIRSVAVASSPVASAAAAAAAEATAEAEAATARPGTTYAPPPESGTPPDIRASRVSCTRSAGTSIAVPPPVIR